MGTAVAVLSVLYPDLQLEDELFVQRGEMLWPMYWRRD